jgi:hypothetical protein
MHTHNAINEPRLFRAEHESVTDRSLATSLELSYQ